MNEKESNNSVMENEEHLRMMKKVIEKQEKSIRINRVVAFAECILLFFLLAAAAILAPRVLKTVNKVDEVVEESNVLIAQAEDSLAELTILVEDTDNLVKTNDQAISDAIDNFNKVDFESLNKSISSLSDILKPLAKLLNAFK